MEFQIALALEWLSAQATRERTPEKLREIVTHGCTAYCLDAAMQQQVYEEALARALRRGLLPS